MGLGVGILTTEDLALRAAKHRVEEHIGLHTETTSEDASAFEVALDLAITYGSGLLHELKRLGLMPASARTIRRYFAPPQCTDGVHPLILRNFIRIAAKTCNSTWTTTTCKRIACCLPVDGIALARNFSYDEYSDCVRGVLPALDLDDVAKRLENRADLGSWLASLTWADTAHLHCATTLCGGMTCPIAVYYAPRLHDSQDVSEVFLARWCSGPLL